MGADAYTPEEFWMKYGHPKFLDRESMHRFFFWMKHTPTSYGGAYMSQTDNCSEVEWRRCVDRVRNLLNHVVQEIRWADRLNRLNHCPHFPFFMTHFIDSMPISFIGGIFSADLWNPKYASHIYKVRVAVDMLGNIVWICRHKGLQQMCSSGMVMVRHAQEENSLILRWAAMMRPTRVGCM